MYDALKIYLQSKLVVKKFYNAFDVMIKLRKKIDYFLKHRQTCYQNIHHFSQCQLNAKISTEAHITFTNNVIECPSF